jgi:YggT family protein
LVGGAEGDRTPDLGIANAALSQLSYSPDRSTTDSPKRRRWCGVGRAEYGEGVGACQARPRRRTSDWLASGNAEKSSSKPAGGSACGSAVLRLPSREYSHSPGNRMRAILWLINTIIEIYVWLLIAQAILSWLLAFGVINRYNRGVSVIGDFLYRVTEPALRPIRRILPNFGGIDISPVVLILILYFVRVLIDEDLAPYLLGYFP